MKRLYWTHPTTYETEVQVTTLGECLVAIEPVVFHPDEGGQPPDKGTIGPATVLSVESIARRSATGVVSLVTAFYGAYMAIYVCGAMGLGLFAALALLHRHAPLRRVRVPKAIAADVDDGGIGAANGTSPVPRAPSVD